MNRGSPFLHLLLALLVSLPSVATAQEVRRIAIRGRHVAPDGTVKLYVSFRSGRDEPLDKIDGKRLQLEIDRRGVSGGGAVKPLVGSGEEAAVLLAIDVSGTMRSAMKEVRVGLQRLDPLLSKTGARVAVGSIGDSWSLNLDFTKDPKSVHRVVGALKAKTVTTALFESIHLGIGQLRQRGSDLPARRLMIVVSDAYNEKKGRTADECVALAGRALIQVHSLIFPTRRTAAYLSRKGELEKISRDSGGTTVTVSSGQEIQRGLSAIFEEVAKEVVVTVSGEKLRNDGREHNLTLRYDRVSSSVSYQAPAVASDRRDADADADADAAVIGHSTGTDARSDGPQPKTTTSSAPATPTISGPGGGVAVPGSILSLPLIAVVVGGVLLLGVVLVVVLLIVRSRRAGGARAAEPAEAAAVTRPGFEAAPPPSTAEPVSPAEPQSRPPAPPSSELQPVQQNIVIGADAAQGGGDPYSRPTLRVEGDGDGKPPSRRSGGGQVSCLRDLYGLVSQEPFRLAKGGARLGSDISNEIVLESPSVSPHHAVIVPASDGFTVRDLGSAHGTYVDDVRVGADPVPIRPGTRIKLGLVTLACE